MQSDRGQQAAAAGSQFAQHHPAEAGENHRPDHPQHRAHRRIPDNADSGSVRRPAAERRQHVPQAEQRRRHRGRDPTTGLSLQQSEQHPAERELLGDRRSPAESPARPAAGSTTTRWSDRRRARGPRETARRLRSRPPRLPPLLRPTAHRRATAASPVRGRRRSGRSPWRPRPIRRPGRLRPRGRPAGRRAATEMCGRHRAQRQTERNGEAHGGHSPVPGANRGLEVCVDPGPSSTRWSPARRKSTTAPAASPGRIRE